MSQRSLGNRVLLYYGAIVASVGPRYLQDLEPHAKLWAWIRGNASVRGYTSAERKESIIRQLANSECPSRFFLILYLRAEQTIMASAIDDDDLP